MFTIAGAAGHAVATHARSVTSRFELAEGKPLVFVHENWLNLLRPAVRVSAQPRPRTATIRHLREVAEASRAAYYRAQTVLGDEKKQLFFQHLCRSSLELAEKLNFSTSQYWQLESS